MFELYLFFLSFQLFGSIFWHACFLNVYTMHEKL